MSRQIKPLIFPLSHILFKPCGITCLWLHPWPNVEIPSRASPSVLQSKVLTFSVILSLLFQVRCSLTMTLTLKLSSCRKARNCRIVTPNRGGSRVCCMCRTMVTVTRVGRTDVWSDRTDVLSSLFIHPTYPFIAGPVGRQWETGNLRIWNWEIGKQGNRET